MRSRSPAIAAPPATGSRRYGVRSGRRAPPRRQAEINRPIKIGRYVCTASRAGRGALAGPVARMCSPAQGLASTLWARGSTPHCVTALPLALHFFISFLISSGRGSWRQITTSARCRMPFGGIKKNGAAVRAVRAVRAHPAGGAVSAGRARILCPAAPPRRSCEFPVRGNGTRAALPSGW